MDQELKQRRLRKIEPIELNDGFRAVFEGEVELNFLRKSYLKRRMERATAWENKAGHFRGLAINVTEISGERGKLAGIDLQFDRLGMSFDYIDGECQMYFDESKGEKFKDPDRVKKHLISIKIDGSGEIESQGSWQIYTNDIQESQLFTFIGDERYECFMGICNMTGFIVDLIDGDKELDCAMVSFMFPEVSEVNEVTEIWNKASEEMLGRGVTEATAREVRRSLILLNDFFKRVPEEEVLGALTIENEVLRLG